MRRMVMAMLTGAALIGTAAPALADERDREDRVEASRDRAENRLEEHQRRERERFDRQWDRREERAERWDDRRDYGYGYGQDRGYRYGDRHWDGRWTPYGFGSGERLTRLWALRNFDYNRNGRLGDREWRDAQRAFYRFADRNRDGYIDRREYGWAQNIIQRDAYAYRR